MIKKTSYKKQKFEEQILQISCQYLRSQIKDTRLRFISFTKVELSGDLTHSKIYWDTFDVATRGDAKKALDGVIGKLRNHLAQILKVKFVPTVTFIYDSQFEDENYITELLKEQDS